MPDFNVSLILTLEVAASFSIESKDEKTALEKANKLADKFSLTWETNAPDNLEVQWEEVEQSTEVEQVEEE